ncbi:MAG: ABC transporter substrate-binding protein [Alphaproteobacteria bacterium]
MPHLSRPCLRAFSLAVFSVFLAVPVSGFAADAPATSVHEQAVQTPVGKFVQDVGDRAIKIIADKKLSTEQRNSAFSKVLTDSFDLKTIGRFVIGRTWNAATPDQQSEYMSLFKALVIKNYGDRMTLAAGENFQVVGTRPESDVDTTVLSQITHSDGSKATTIDWRVRQQDGKMGVIDVIVEGISLSVTQRQEYASVVQNSGGQIDGLLDTMRNQLKGTTVSTAQ